MKAILAYSPQLRKQINRTIAVEQAKPDTPSSWRADFLNRLLPYATGGKLIRGNLVCFSYEAFTGRKPTGAVVETAAALELIHSALLIHDDVMDNDDFRRGRPSMHRQYEAAGRREKLGGAERFGANMALCGGDMCLFMAFGLIAKVQDDPATPSSLRQFFTQILVEVCDGQMQDIYSQSLAKPPSKRAIYDLMKAKTASYTLSLPLVIGAILAAQPQSVLNKLQRVGDATGIIFQIRDDELGALGKTSETGKPVGADIREGKKTLIYYYLMKNCSRYERDVVRCIFGNLATRPEDIEKIQKMIIRHRIPKLLNADVKVLEKKAYAALRSIKISKSNNDELESLIRFCSQRRT